MDFSNLILEKIGSFVEEYNFRIVEERSYYLKLQSDNLIIIVVHNEMENSNTLWLAENETKINNIEIDNEVLKLFFNSDLKLSQVSIETFVNNLALFLQNEAEPLLNGITGKFAELQKFDLDRSKKYTQELLINNTLEIADKAWEVNDYANFVKSIDKLPINEIIPQSYRLKYKIAKQKL